jgi:malate synthase
MLQLTRPLPAAAAGTFGAEALQFVGELVERFQPRVDALLAARVERQREIDAGVLPGFRPETAGIRESEWRVAEPPADLLDRRVEITGPADRKMIINGLNSGARVYMADFEDSLAPSFDNVAMGQQHLRDAVARRIGFTQQDGRTYQLGANVATLIVRPRGWHLPERHVTRGGRPIPGALLDFGIYLFNNHAELRGRSTGPYFYLPKLEGYLEARLWAEVFAWSEARLGLPRSTIRGTVLIETILAAFEMDEILHELRDYAVALNCGRWDYIFSYIKKFRNLPGYVLPDRHAVTMTVPFMRAYSLLCIRTCHRRGALAMGGMAAQIPIRDDPAANDAALAKVRADKEREASDGHDGTWVAHPALVPVAKEVFDRLMPTPNQRHRDRSDVAVEAHELLAPPAGAVTEAGFRNNVAVSLRYLGAWLGGQGCVAIFNLMEDAATAEIARAQLWQWLHVPEVHFDDGRPITPRIFREVLERETAALASATADAGDRARVGQASDLLRELVESREFVDFLTLPAYGMLHDRA